MAAAIGGGLFESVVLLRSVGSAKVAYGWVVPPKKQPTASHRFSRHRRGPTAVGDHDHVTDWTEQPRVSSPDIEKPSSMVLQGTLLAVRNRRSPSFYGSRESETIGKFHCDA